MFCVENQSKKKNHAWFWFTRPFWKKSLPSVQNLGWLNVSGVIIILDEILSDIKTRLVFVHWCARIHLQKMCMLSNIIDISYNTKLTLNNNICIYSYPLHFWECLLQLLRSLNLFLHLIHWYGKSPVWILVCLFNDDFRVNNLLQILHLNGLSPVWILICCCKFDFCLNALVQ